MGGTAAVLIDRSFPVTLQCGSAVWTGNLKCHRDGLTGVLTEQEGPGRMDVTVAAAEFYLRSASHSSIAKGGRLIRQWIPAGELIEDGVHTVVGGFVMRFPGGDKLTCQFRDSRVIRADPSRPDHTKEPVWLEITKLLDQVTRAFRRLDEI